MLVQHYRLLLNINIFETILEQTKSKTYFNKIKPLKRFKK